MLSSKKPAWIGAQSATQVTPPLREKSGEFRIVVREKRCMQRPSKPVSYEASSNTGSTAGKANLIQGT